MSNSLELPVRRLATAERLIAEFATVEDARAWLRERPPGVEVLWARCALPPGLGAELRALARPLDENERERSLELDARDAQDRLEAFRQRRAEAEAAAADDDPHRPMVVRWARGEGMWLPDEDDERTIPSVVERAVLDWIEERDGWVWERRQVVATAIVSVWPGPVPGGREADRIQPGGKFVTMSRGHEDN